MLCARDVGKEQGTARLVKKQNENCSSVEVFVNTFLLCYCLSLINQKNENSIDEIYKY